MTRKAQQQASEAATLTPLYLVLVGIENDDLLERYEPGDVTPLTGWPVEVLADWLEQGVITEVIPDEPAG